MNEDKRLDLILTQVVEATAHLESLGQRVSQCEILLRGNDGMGGIVADMQREKTQLLVIQGEIKTSLKWLKGIAAVALAGGAGGTVSAVSQFLHSFIK